MFDDFMDDEEQELFENDAPETPYVSAPGLLPPRENPDLFGHEAHEKMLLSLFNENKLPHALIFAGPMGVGKTTMAFRLARFLLKEGGTDTGMDSMFGDVPAVAASMQVAPDDPVFRKVVSGGHPDLKYIERPFDEKRGVYKSGVDIESIRQIPAFLRMTSADGGWRIVIVDEADTMTRQAQNGILKILEEPPAKALLILICNRLGAMIPTIRSRCRTLNFSPLDAATLTTLLKRAAPDATSGEISTISMLADGSVGRALSLHEEKGINTLNSILSFLEGWPEWDWARIHPWADNLSKGEEKAYQSFATLFEWTAQSFLRAKAIGPQTLAEILKNDRLSALQTHYSLEQWIDICEKLKNHFIAIENSNLDKRQGVIGAFAILGGQIA